MNRCEEMSSFLNFLAKMYEQNPTLEVNEKTIYSLLCNYGLEEEELKDKDISFMRERWITHFQNDFNLHCFVSPSQPYFLQFHNARNLGDKHVKLYLSYPKEKMEECVNKIFDYIALHNMATVSKVARVIRSDAIVIRLDKLTDAKKVIQFINKDKMLTEYAKPTNPFVVRCGVVGVAYDDCLSFNCTLSFLLKKYFSECRKNQTLAKVSLEDFSLFSQKLYQTIFYTPHGIQEFVKEQEVQKNVSRFAFASIGRLLLNYEQVLTLISKSLNPDMTIEDFATLHTSFKKDNQELIDYYNDLFTNQVEQKKDEKKQLLDEYICYAKTKYGIEDTIAHLNIYLNGNLAAITRDKNFRYRFQTDLPPAVLLKITNNDVANYIKNYFNMYIEKPTDWYTCFLNACLATYLKYGYGQLKQAITSGLEGDYRYFTNTQENYRKKFSMYLKKEEFFHLCVHLLRDTHAFQDDFVLSTCEGIISLVPVEYSNQNRK